MPTLRALAAACALAAPLAFAPSASAIPTCPDPGSTRLADVETVAGGRVRLLAHGGDVCLYSNAAGVVVSVDPDGRVEVWRTGGTLVDDAACLPERVAYLLDESQSDAWYECINDPHRVV